MTCMGHWHALGDVNGSSTIGWVKEWILQKDGSNIEAIIETLLSMLSLGVEGLVMELWDACDLECWQAENLWKPRRNRIGTAWLRPAVLRRKWASWGNSSMQLHWCSNHTSGGRSGQRCSGSFLVVQVFLSVYVLQAVEEYSISGLDSALYALALHYGGAAWCSVPWMSPGAGLAFDVMSEQCSFKFSFESMCFHKSFVEAYVDQSGPWHRPPYRSCVLPGSAVSPWKAASWIHASLDLAQSMMLTIEILQAGCRWLRWVTCGAGV